MNNIEDKKKTILQNFFIIFVFFCITFFITRFFSGVKKEPLLQKELTFYQILLDKELPQKDLSEIFDPKSKTFSDKKGHLDIFQIGVESKSKRFYIKNVENKIDVWNDSKFLEYIEGVLKGEKNFFFIKSNKFDLNGSQKLSYIRDFFNFKIGTNKKYLKQKIEDFQNLQETKLPLRICKFDKNKDFQITPLVFEINGEEDLAIKDKDNKPIHSKYYNDLIKTRLNKDGSINSFYLKPTNSSEPIKIFIDDSGDLPIQWSNKLNWNFCLYWGYIWNVLIILIASVLSFFSSIFSGVTGGYFFGNLGLGIILTTLLIRTLLWPIYAKSNSFNMNMSFMQPEISKIKEKYILKRDRESLQKMQMEISKVYKKHNFNIFSIFTTFLQIPVFIAMFRTLNRCRVSGGIFSFELFVQKPFLGFIYLDSSNPKYGNFCHLLVRIFLSLLIGISMFILNKINEKKSAYLKQNDKILSDEQKLKKKNQEKTMKIVSYIMIFFMVITSFKDLFISLYWIVGNIYTIFQTILNRKMIDKKYFLLKQKGF